MKATIKREINFMGDKFLAVYADDKHVRSLLYDDSEEGRWSEKSQFEIAMLMCKGIEANGSATIIETIYETPNQ